MISFEKILTHLGFEAYTDMQLQMQENYTDNKDIVLLAPTGSGKTVAFLSPLVASLEADSAHVQAIIISPTRELALQIEDVFKRMKTGLKVSLCYGGHNVKTEINNLRETPAVVIGTPGRIADLIDRKILNVFPVRTLVLDEFDKSLELGFHEEIKYILSKIEKTDKRVFVSATDIEEYPAFVKIKNPARVDFLHAGNSSGVLNYQSIVASQEEKNDVLLKLLGYAGKGRSLVFVNQRVDVEGVSNFLRKKNVTHVFYHGGMPQPERERALVKFRNGSAMVLVTTDVAARGLDIPEINSVVHYDLPLKKDDFIHRNGRSARMNAAGSVYILLHPGQTMRELVDGEVKEMKLDAKSPLPLEPEWETLYVHKGKKDKINKGDIAGFLYQKGNLEAGEVGMIEVKDFHSFVAVKRSKAVELVNIIRNEKLKSTSVKMEIAR